MYKIQHIRSWGIRDC